MITNGTAVLGLGDIGPEASKPVMEGKALLFKIFADIDVFDIEIGTKDIYKRCLRLWQFPNKVQQHPENKPMTNLFG